MTEILTPETPDAEYFDTAEAAVARLEALYRQASAVITDPDDCLLGVRDEGYRNFAIKGRAIGVILASCGNGF